MKTLTLTSAQQKIETQKYSVYVKVQNYYTATVRSLTSFVNFLNENRETLCELEITNSGDVSDEFLQAVKEIIEAVNNPQEEQVEAPKKLKATLKMIMMNDEGEHSEYETNYWSIGVEATGKDANELIYQFADYCHKKNEAFQCCYCPAEDENSVFEYFNVVAEEYSKKEFVSEFRKIMKSFKQSLKK